MHLSSINLGFKSHAEVVGDKTYMSGELDDFLPLSEPAEAYIPGDNFVLLYTAPLETRHRVERTQAHPHTMLENVIVHANETLIN